MTIRRATVAVAAMLALAACGGSGGGSDAPVKIGVITSLSGQYSVLGTFDKKTLDLLAKQANAAGGINGRRVELVYQDDQTNPTQAATALRTLSRQGVTAIVGPVLSSSCAAIVDQVEALKIPMVTTCASDAQVEPVRRYTFMSTLSTTALTERITGYLLDGGIRRVGLLYDDGDFGKSGSAELTKRGRLDIAETQSYSLRSTTFVPQLTSLKRADVQAVIVWGAGPPLVTIAKEYAQLGAGPPLVMSAAAATPLFLGPAGAAGNGVIMASSLSNVVAAAPDHNASKAEVQRLASDYRAAYGEEMSQFTADACGAWKVIAGAIRMAGADPEKVRDAIESTPTVGCHGTYTYRPADHRGLSASDVWIAVDRDGALVATDYSKRQTAK